MKDYKKMKTIKQLKQKKEEIEKQIQELEEAEKLKDFQEFSYKGKKYRIYKWENKPFQDFVCPKGYRWADGLELIRVINESNFEFEKFPVYYYSTSLFKKGCWELFRVSLYGRDWSASGGSLAVSSGSDRVVCVEVRN